MKSAFEAMGGTYRQCGDFFIPEMTLPDTPGNPIGKYGRMRHRYLKEHREVLYNAMILNSINFSHERNHDYENISDNQNNGIASRTQESEVQWQKTKAAKTM